MSREQVGVVRPGTDAEPVFEKEDNIVRLQQQVTPAWDAPNGVFEHTELEPGHVGPLEITPLARFIADPQLREDIIDAMAHGGIEAPEASEEEPVTDAQLDEIESEMTAIFATRFAAEEKRRLRGEKINGYHDEAHNQQVAERLLDILRYMKQRPSHEVARLMVLNIAPRHDEHIDADGNVEPHPGVAVRKEADGLSVEQMAQMVLDGELRGSDTSLYRRIQAAGMVLATSNFWDGKTIAPQTQNEYIVVIADLGGYREHYAEWARQSIGVLKERISEMKRDLTLYEAEKAKGKTVHEEVIKKLREARPADSLVGFFKFQKGFATYLDEGFPQADGSVFGQVNKKFADKVIEGGEEAWPWTHQLREHKQNLAALLSAAEAVKTQGGSFEQHWQQPATNDRVGIETVRWLEEQIAELQPILAEVDQRISALAA